MKKIRFCIFAPALLVPAVLFLASCGRGGERLERPFAPNAGAVPAGQGEAAFDEAELARSLERLAEIERSGSYRQGLALAESALRENAGDFAGAVAAAYKELSFAYGYGSIPKETLREGLLNVLALREAIPHDAARRAAEGILAFDAGDWAGAETVLNDVFGASPEGAFAGVDSFDRWMLLVCALEQDRNSRRASEMYRAIRSRYAQFPEYWYRGAVFFSGDIGADYAERCVSLAPQGPFAAPCRTMLALGLGLKNEDGSALKTKSEIEALVSRSVSERNPEILAALIPLISLPDNPYTVYAVGALRALSAVPAFRDFFISGAAASRGRLAERLAYISRG